MPSLFRFLLVLLILTGIAYATMIALVMFVEPNPREMTIRVPKEKFNPPGRLAGGQVPRR